MASSSSTVRVGLLVLTALVALGIGVFLIGDQNRLFVKKNDYFIKVKSVSGLNTGNPVQLNGVTVGSVDRIVLPRDVAQEFLVIWVSVEDHFADRIRADSVARIRTLGLLGDKFVDISSGSLDAPVIPPGGQIPTAGATDVDRLISSGEDVVDNMVAISHSLKNILERVDRGEGLVGELTTDQEAGRRITTSLAETLEAVEGVAVSIQEGQGPLARLIHDEALADRLVGAVERIEGILAEVEHGDGLVPALLTDAETKRTFQETLTDLRETAADVRAFSENLESDETVLGRLAADEELGAEVSAQIQRVVTNLGDVAEKLNRGDGTAAKLINDPQIYDAVNDIVVGVNESKMLRWLIRNRQKKGIEKRFDDAVDDTGPTAEEPPETAAPDGEGGTP